MWEPGEIISGNGKKGKGEKGVLRGKRQIGFFNIYDGTEIRDEGENNYFQN